MKNIEEGFIGTPGGCFQRKALANVTFLFRLVPEFPAFDSEREKSLEAEQESRSPPPALMTVLDTCRAAVDLIMGDVPVGEPVVVETDTEEDMYTRGYLFCWDLLLTFFKSAPSEVSLTQNKVRKEQLVCIEVCFQATGIWSACQRTCFPFTDEGKVRQFSEGQWSC